jgi:hypothetical protein
VREGGRLSLADANLSAREGKAPKKRKRNDEDDSAEEEEADETRPLTSLSGSSVFPGVFQEIEALLQKPSAKARLLSRRVCICSHQYLIPSDRELVSIFG